jgi:hypothetical protein
VPFALGLCTNAATTVESSAANELPGSATPRSWTTWPTEPATALAVAGVHTLAMIGAGLGMAWLVYRYLGLRVLRSTWFNLDTVWGASLIAAGAAGIGLAL